MYVFKNHEDDLIEVWKEVENLAIGDNSQRLADLSKLVTTLTFFRHKIICGKAALKCKDYY